MNIFCVCVCVLGEYMMTYLTDRLYAIACKPIQWLFRKDNVRKK